MMTKEEDKDKDKDKEQEQEAPQRKAVQIETNESRSSGKSVAREHMGLGPFGKFFDNFLWVCIQR